MKFQFKMQRQETREGVLYVEAESFAEATKKALEVKDNKIPRGCSMRKPFMIGEPFVIEFIITSGREL